MDAAGGAPILRGLQNGFGAIAKVAWWEARQADRKRRGPVRAMWPALASNVPAHGHDRPGQPASPGTPARVIPERESLELLRAAGIHVVESIAVEGRVATHMLTAATAAADRLGWPVAVKLDAPGLAHKTDVGAVELDVDAKRLAGAIRRVLAAGREYEPDGVLIQPMARAGVELIVGARRDGQFGPLVLVGLGGIHAEVLDDVALRLAPIDAADASEMLDELRGARLLGAIRGRRAIDRAAVVEILVGLSRAVVAHPEWRDVDLNPVLAAVAPHGALAVDALIVADPVDPAWDFEDPGGRAHV
jgi:acetate---CoA ligase (ADP-forming)